MQRVNKVTVRVEEGQAIITMWNGNTKLAQITNDDIDIDDFKYNKMSDVTQGKYQSFCKAIVINLLENGGIEGYYWEQQEEDGETKSDKMGKKYDRSGLITGGCDKILTILQKMLVDTNISFGVSTLLNDTQVDIPDKYNDGTVKNGVAEFNVEFTNKDTKVVKLVQIKVEIRSGQLCNPTQMGIDKNTTSLNRTNIMKLFK